MADEYTGTNWWDSSSRNRFDVTAGSSSSSSSTSSSGMNSLGGGGCGSGSFGWSTTEMVDVVKGGRSSMESGSVSDGFHDPHNKLQHGHDSTGHDHHLHMMGLGLSSQAMDWNQALLRGDKGEGSFRSMLQENLNLSANYQQESGIGSSQVQWRERVFTGLTGDSSMNEYKQLNRGGFSLEQPSTTQFSPHGSSSDSTVTCQGLHSGNFQMDSSAIYGSPSTMLQGLFGSDHDQPQQQQQSSMSYHQYGAAAANYGIGSNELLPSWSKVPQFLRNSPPKQPLPPPPPHSQLHFSNNAPFWNASASTMTDVRPNFFPSLQPQFPTSSFDEKPKNVSDQARDSISNASSVKKSGSEAAASTKRPRNETPTPLPAAFKVRKEKMGDRITALQQLVSPFGKTDTASVLSEAIEYIKFLHDQVNVLSTPYMKRDAAIHHHQQGCDKSKDPEGQKQDLRSRGLCLVPISSTFPVTHETTVDFWTPTFGGTYR